MFKIKTIFLNLWMLLEGNHSQQLSVSILLGILFSPFGYALSLGKKYVLADVDFVEVLLILIITDWASGMVKHWKLKEFSFSKMFTGLTLKVFVSMVAMIATNALLHIKGLDAESGLISYFGITLKLANALYVGGSVFNNLYFLTGQKFPPKGWMAKMEGFNEKGEISSFKDTYQDSGEGMAEKI